MYIVTADTISTDLEAPQSKSSPFSIAAAGLLSQKQSSCGSNQRGRSLNVLDEVTNVIEEMFPAV